MQLAGRALFVFLFRGVCAICRANFQRFRPIANGAVWNARPTRTKVETIAERDELERFTFGAMKTRRAREARN